MADPEEAAENAVDPSRLLPGELENTTDPEDITTWAAVYEDLVSFKRELLNDIRAGLGDRLPEARREIEEVDIVTLQAELDRLQRRHDFWHRRLLAVRQVR